MYSLESATQTANRVVELLAPHCERIHIAGSIRRKKETVKDIEVVCQPIKVFVKDKTDLFGAGDWAVSPEFIKTIEYFT